MRIFLLLVVVSICSSILLSACASKPKSSARIYEGDAPTIRYDPSHAGGPVSTY